MVDSDVVIGLAEENFVGDYYVEDWSMQGIKVDDQSDISNTLLTQEDDLTVLKFTRRFNSEDSLHDLPISKSKPTTFIYAFGSTNTWEFHRERGKLTIDFSKEEFPSSDEKEL